MAVDFTNTWNGVPPQALKQDNLTPTEIINFFFAEQQKMAVEGLLFYGFFITPAEYPRTDSALLKVICWAKENEFDSRSIAKLDAYRRKL